MLPSVFRISETGQFLLDVVLSNSSQYQLADQGGGEGLGGSEANRALAGGVALEVRRVGRDQRTAHRIERAVVLRRGVGHERAAQAEGGQAVAETLLRLRRRRSDLLAQLLQRGPLFRRKLLQVRVDGRGLQRDTLSRRTR